MDITWTCHICDAMRPDASISVRKTDISGQHNLPPGTMFQNVRYCNDDPECAERSKTYNFVKQEGKQ